MTAERALLLGRRASTLTRMRAIATGIRGSEPARRVHLLVSIDRFLRRLLATTAWAAWVVKGGYATCAPRTVGGSDAPEPRNDEDPSEDGPPCE